MNSFRRANSADGSAAEAAEEDPQDRRVAQKRVHGESPANNNNNDDTMTLCSHGVARARYTLTPVLFEDACVWSRQPYHRIVDARDSAT
jgi:hypothetical protein